jgi:hypothetical protein
VCDDGAPGGGRGNCRSCGAMIVWFKTSAGKNYYLKVQVSAR